MAEYIGARISLISKSDIRYVGTLHEINSENSTVALENVRSMGTEDRRSGAGSVAANERLYEYIVFRGSDVKDLRIEEAPKPQEVRREEVPDDPAILGSTRPPHQTGTPSQQPQPSFNQPPPYAQGFPPYPPPMHNQGFGRGGFPPPGPGAPGGPGGPGFGYPGPGPYGVPPPGWFPPGGQGFPPGPGGPPGPFAPQPPGGAPPPQQLPGGGPPPPRKQPTPIGPKDGKAPQEQKKQELPAKVEGSKTQSAAAAATAPLPAAAKDAATPPVETKPDVAAVTAPPAPTTQAQAQAQAPPTGPKNRAPIPINRAPIPTQSGQKAVDPQSFASATQAATAAVAAAMAKLPMAQKVGQTPEGGVDNLTKKVQEMRTDDHIRHGRQQGTGGHVAGGHRGRGRGRGGHHQQTRPVEVPTTDFDFAESNAKFNKEDLAKTTASPLATPGDEVNGSSASTPAVEEKTQQEEVVIPKAENVYDRKTSFFDNISSELKDKQAASGSGPGGREFRSEERKKNMETFGQGSVDNGYRRGYGRGRGRGFRIQSRGRGGGGYGGQAPRGGSQVQSS